MEKTKIVPKLLKSQRCKKRYLYFETKGLEQLNGKRFFFAILDFLNSFFGKQNFSEKKISIVYCSNGKGILRCKHTFQKELKEAIESFNSFSGKKISVKVCRASGSIKKLKKYFENGIKHKKTGKRS